MYLMSTLRYSTAASILGSITRMILPVGFSCIEEQKRRLLRHCCILDQSLSLCLSTPPLITPHVLDGFLADGHGGDEITSCLTQQFFLAKIQARSYEMLRSAQSSKKNSKEFLEETMALLSDLENWKGHLPNLLRIPVSPAELEQRSNNIMPVVTMLCGYWQTLVSIYSAIFSQPRSFNDTAIRGQVLIAVNQCALVVRQALYLMKHLKTHHWYSSYVRQ